MARKNRKARNNKAVTPQKQGPNAENLDAKTSVVEQTKEVRQARFLVFLEEHHGVIEAACQASGVKKSTIYQDMKKDQVFAAKVKEVRVSAGGFHVESKMFELINGVKVISPDGQEVYQRPPNQAMIRRYLDSEIGAELGYKHVSKTEHEGQVGGGFAIFEMPDNGRSVKSFNENQDQGLSDD